MTSCSPVVVCLDRQPVNPSMRILFLSATAGTYIYRKCFSKETNCFSKWSSKRPKAE